MRSYNGRVPFISGLRRMFLIAGIMLASQSEHAFAQTSAQPRKIAIINTGYFSGDERGQRGINSYAIAMRQMTQEFAPMTHTLDTLAKRQAALTAEIEDLKSQNASPVALKAKVDQRDQVAKEFSAQQASAKAQYTHRLEQSVIPIQQRVSSAMQEFLKSRGYTDVMDTTDVNAPKPPIDAIDETANFIAWYNSLPLR